MPDNATTFSPAQKERYVGIVNEVLNSKQQLWGWLDKVPSDGGGVAGAAINTGSTGTTTQRGLHFTVHLGRNATGTFQDPEANFPTSGNQQYVQGYMQGRTIYWPMQVSRAIIARTKSDDAAYARVMVEAAVRTGNDLRNELDRVSWGDGSGVLAVMSGAATGAGATITIPIDNYQDLRKFWIGQYITMWDKRYNGSANIVFGSGTTVNNVGKVTGITMSTSAPTIQVQSVSGAAFTGVSGTPGAATNVIVKGTIDTSSAATSAGSARGASTRYEIMGIDGIVLDCDSPVESGGSAGLFGILAPTQYGTTVNTQGASGATNASGFPAWSSYVNRSSANRAFNDALLMSLFDRPMIDYGERPNLLATSYGGRWEYVNSKLGIRRYVNTPSLGGSQSGGFTESEEGKTFAEFNDTPIVPGRYAPTWCLTNTAGAALNTTYFALNLNTLKVYEWHPIRFMDDDGLTWRMIQRTPFFEGVLEYTCELMTFARNSHAKVINVLATDFT